MTEQISYTPAEMAERTIEVAEKKSNNKASKTFLLAILAGIYIALGSVFSNTAMTGGAVVWPFGVAKFLGGLAFSVGLILVVVGGAELFTGNTSLVAAWIDKKISGKRLLRNWLLVYFGNFVGAIIIACLVVWGKQYTFGSGAVGQTLISSVYSKLHLGFVQAIVLGIICNLLVCLAVWLATSAKDTTGKILAIILPITAFVAMGGEHSVANMYQLTAAWMIKVFDPSFVNGLKVADLNWFHIIFHNLIPVTIGNIIGGAMIWLGYWKIYLKK